MFTKRPKSRPLGKHAHKGPPGHPPTCYRVNFRPQLDPSALPAGLHDLASGVIAHDVVHRPLHRCENLAPAGTGTSSLSSLLSELRARQANLSDDMIARSVHSATRRAELGLRRWPEQREQPLVWQLAHHRHDLRPSHFGRVSSQSCFLLTVRDPVARVFSGVLHSVAQSNFSWNQLLESANSFISALRIKTHVRHHWAVHLLQLSGQPKYVRCNTCAGVPSGGWNFLTPQVHYLRGLTCSGAHVYLLCTETLNDDWARIVGMESQVAHLTSALNMRVRNLTRGHGGLSAENAAFIRRTFVDDFKLHEAACKRTRSGHRRHSR